MTGQSKKWSWDACEMRFLLILAWLLPMTSPWGGYLAPRRRLFQQNLYRPNIAISSSSSSTPHSSPGPFEQGLGVAMHNSVQNSALHAAKEDTTLDNTVDAPASMLYYDDVLDSSVPEGVVCARGERPLAHFASPRVHVVATLAVWSNMFLRSSLTPLISPPLPTQESASSQRTSKR